MNEDLSFTHVTRSHAGHYKCRAENGLEPAIEIDFQLLVSGMIVLLAIHKSYELVFPATGPLCGL